jgi:hypothetical protein
MQEPEWNREPDSLIEGPVDKIPIKDALDAQDRLAESFRDLTDEFAGMASPIAPIGISNSKHLLLLRD